MFRISAGTQDILIGVLVFLFPYRQMLYYYLKLRHALFLPYRTQFLVFIATQSLDII
jgi:hypothetical protein